MKRKKIILTIAAIIALFVIIVAYLLFSSPYSGKNTTYIYIDTDDNTDSVYTKLAQADCGTACVRLLSMLRSYNVRTGRYALEPGIKGFNLYRHLRNHQQEAVRLTIPSVRTLDRMAGVLSQHLMLDSATIINALNDSAFVERLGYSTQTLPALFIPNTYEIYWDISLEKLFNRLQQEKQRFWTAERRAKADELHLSTTEVYTLASIVDEETANNAEKPKIAQMYLNRLNIGMPLQADPTIKMAVGDWTLRRILYEHLHVKSPYNTYMNVGLCPGPIRVASIAGIEAVLNHANHNYLYMCAKEDFSGTHNFAATYEEHMQNARRYSAALNERGIK